MSATSEIIARVALWWVDKRPLSKEARERRKAKRAERKQRKGGSTMAIDLGTRTSTNTVVGTSLFGSIAVQLIQLLPYPALVSALTTPEAVILWGSVIAWIVSRVSKTPETPKLL